MEQRRYSPTHEKQAERLADLQEYLDVLRYPSRVEMLRTVDAAAQRAESMARLERALERLAD